jgi:hypothetical protein
MPIDDGFADGPADTAVATGTETAMEPDNTDVQTEESPFREETQPASESQDSQREVESSGDEHTAEGQDKSTDETSGLPESLVREAKDHYLFTDDDLAAYSDPKDLTRHLGIIDRHTATRYMQEADRQSRPAQEEQKPVSEGEERKGWTPSKLELDLKEDELDPDVVSALQKITNHYNEQLAEQNKQVEQMQSALGGYTEEQEAQVDAAYEQGWDSWFSGLSDQFGGVFGSGRMRDLSDRSHGSARLEIEQTSRSLFDNDVQNGRNPLPMEAYAQRALRSIYPDKIDQQTRQTIRDEANKRRGQAIRRPVTRTGKTGNPGDRAGEFANEFYRDRDIDLNKVMTSRRFSDGV